MKCDRCGKVIRFPTFSTKEDQPTGHTRRNGKREEEHFITVSICFWYVFWDRLFSWAKDHAALLLAVVLLSLALIWLYGLPLQARSQETTVYQNPDFPCVRAINPTVTDSACSGHCKAPLALQARRAYLRGMFKAFEFCIPTSGTNVPNGTDWLHEIKYDGYRLRVERDGDRVRLITKSRAIRFTDRIFSREMVERMETSQQKTRKAQEIHNTNVWDAITVALEELIKNLEELDLRMTLAAAVRFKETFEASAELPSENHIGELTFRSTGRKIWYRHIYSSNRRSPSPHGGHASAAIMDSFFMARSP